MAWPTLNTVYICTLSRLIFAKTNFCELKKIAFWEDSFLSLLKQLVITEYINYIFLSFSVSKGKFIFKIIIFRESYIFIFFVESNFRQFGRNSGKLIDLR